MIYAFYGEGKGKTTSAVGTLLRSLNLKKRVILIQLYKNLQNIKSNELEFLQNLNLPHFQLIQFGKNKGWVSFKKPSHIDKDLTQKAIKKIMVIINTKKIDLLVIDEILLSHYYGLCTHKQVLQIIKSCNQNGIDLILTGRKMKKSLLPYIDLATGMKKIKHPFDKKIRAKEGLDY